jgi:hypothetical protein
MQYPTFGHEILSSLFLIIDVKDPRGFPLFSLGDSGLPVGGSADVKLVDGIKSPDWSLYEDHPNKQPIM